MIKKREKVFITFTKLDENKGYYLDKLIAGEIEIYILLKNYPPFKISLAELS